MYMLSSHRTLCLAVNKNVPESELVTHHLEGVSIYEVRFDKKYAERVMKIAKPFNTYIEVKKEG
ncbi:hypothetical protein [Sutcliffiella horikoshii]|uniref:hypothetical protein n=1 Tax=Sutcliffiella horikoshii TaxID=79883 RepID=UPI001F441B2D|nr:hypothetical protein [Sutcliffiella horikoshii]MCG1020781.1 hypothetical protein [Sutcliffiella horikoshii]